MQFHKFSTTFSTCQFLMFSNVRDLLWIAVFISSERQEEFPRIRDFNDRTCRQRHSRLKIEKKRMNQRSRNKTLNCD